MIGVTHDQRRRALRSVLLGCGYSAREIAENFKIWSPGQQTVQADFVAFTSPDQQDMSTSAIVGHVVDAASDIQQRWLPAAAALAAPVMLAALPDRLTAWTSARTNVRPDEVASVPVTTPDAMISRLAALSPTAVALAKTQGRQRTLFPLDLQLLGDSRERARTYLTNQVELALRDLAGPLRDARRELAPKIVIGALAMLVIRDKTEIGIVADGSTPTLIDVAQQRYPAYFGWLPDLSTEQFEIFSHVVDDIGLNINFASLEPSMVSHVYEQALVTRKLRRQQGTYYTPPQLADQMLNIVPVEHVEPTQRMILDPACGSGTMLLAAAHRLTKLQLDRTDSRRWHRYLTSHLRGYDNDPFAVEITKLCLLTTALPIGNSWQVDSVDTLSMRLSNKDRPSIIVSNPPWQYDRDPGRTAERANIFLSWMLDTLADDGFLACVVPLSWLNRDNSRSSRRSVLQRATLLEAWRLPSNTFPTTRSTIAPAVIVAQKNASGHSRGRVTLIKTVRDESLAAFYSSGFAEEAYLVEPGDDGSRLTNGPLTRAIATLTNFTTIGNIAQVLNGTPKLPGRPERTRSSANHYELGSLRDLQAFGPVDSRKLTPVRYPEDYYKANPNDARVRAHKVVVTAKNFSTRNPWRIAVGYDDYGASLREMFHMVMPDGDWEPWANLTESERFFALMAVLGSGMASCWIDENEPTRNIAVRRIKSIPFPNDADLVKELARVGGSMALAVSTGYADRLDSAARALEATVNRIYELPLDARLLIENRLANASAPEGIVRYPRRAAFAADGLAGAASEIPSFGHVLSAAEDGLQLWISGITDASGAHVPAPRQIPGWLCQAGSDFQVAGGSHNLRQARFSFHNQDWLTEDELQGSGLIPRSVEADDSS